MSAEASDVIPMVSSRSPFEVTAGVASARLFAIATLNWTGRSLRLVPTASRLFAFADEDIQSVKSAAAEIATFLKQLDIDQLALLRGNYTGPYRASHLNIHMEAALELSTQLNVVRVPTNGVSGWLAYRSPLMPLPDPSLKGWPRRVHERAIETAAYVASRVLAERVLRETHE